MTDDEVDALLQGVEDSQGQVNYEGWSPFINSRQGHVQVYYITCGTCTPSIHVDALLWTIYHKFALSLEMA